MKKIPTLFQRDPSDMSRVLDEIHPDCAWVVDGEGIATQKVDGTSCLFEDGAWWKRREIKKGKVPPPDFREASHDAATGKRTGWVPVTDEDRWHREAIARLVDSAVASGSYELLGPKIQGNPEGFAEHTLVEHATLKSYPDAPTDRAALASWLSEQAMEGLVWHHPDGRMAKIKRRDFGLPWPIKGR